MAHYNNQHRPSTEEYESSTPEQREKHLGDGVDVADLSRYDTNATTASEKVNNQLIEQFTPEEQRKIVRRVDRRLVLTLGCLYCVSLMDRTNTGIAVVAGMGNDLLLIGNRYNIVVLVFFITYVLLQPPATVILRKIGPRMFLPTITVLWGVVMIGMAFVRDWTQLAVLRVILGIFEAGLFPGGAYLLSCWYPRYDLQKRNAVFYLIGSMASAFAGILAYGFSRMAGLGNGQGYMGTHVYPTRARPVVATPILPGVAGWRWIFIMEGIITCLAGFVGFLFLVDFPEKATKSGIFKFLNEDEAAFIVARIENDRHDAIPEKFAVGKYLANSLDLKVWGFATLFMLTTTCTYAIAYFLPIILQAGMGFSVAAAQCLIAPPYVFAGIQMFACAWAGDKYHIRSPFIILNGALCLVGLALLGLTSNVGVRYFGVFLAVGACNSNIPCILTWQANNIRGQWKRALCSATLVGAGGIGGIIGGTVFRTADSPYYKPGIIATMLASGLIVLISLLLVFKFSRANKRAESGGKVIEGLKGFRYTL